MPTLKYKDGNTWKEFSLFGNSGSTGGMALINITGEPNATISYTNTTGTDKGSVKLNSNGIGGVYVVTDDTYTLKDTSTSVQKKTTVKSTYHVNLQYTIGLRIDTTNSDPEKAITYIDAAEGMSPGWDNWKDTPWFKNIRPCILQNGVVTEYLSRDDISKTESGGTPSGGTNINNGDYMVEIPKLGWNFYHEDENHVILQLTSKENAPGFSYLAHSLNKEGDCDKIYIGTFLGYYTANALGSFNTTTRRNDCLTTLSNFRNAAAKRGEGYQQFSYYVLLLLQILYLFVFKNFNSQETIGDALSVRYNTALNINATALTTMFGGNTNGTVTLGVRDLWDYQSQWIDGIYFDKQNYIIKTAYGNFDNNGENYPYSFSIDPDRALGGGMSNFTTKAHCTNIAGFFPLDDGGSGTTYYCDNGVVNVQTTSNYTAFYMVGNLMSTKGIFSIVEAPPSFSTTNGRLVYKHLKA